MKKYNVWMALIAVAILAMGGYLFPQAASVFSGVGTRFPNGLCVGSTCSVTQNKLTVGNSGTALGNVIYGTCYLLSDFSIAATSTGMVDCVNSNFTAGDTVIIGGLATSSVALTRQFSIVGFGSASTTSGYAPVRVTNWTGAAVIPSSLNGLGSSTPFMIIRP